MWQEHSQGAAERAQGQTTQALKGLGGRWQMFRRWSPEWGKCKSDILLATRRRCHI